MLWIAYKALVTQRKPNYPKTLKSEFFCLWRCGSLCLSFFSPGHEEPYTILLKLNTAKLERDCPGHKVRSLSVSKCWPHPTLHKQAGVLLLPFSFLMRGYFTVSLLWCFSSLLLATRLIFSWSVDTQCLLVFEFNCCSLPEIALSTHV